MPTPRKYQTNAARQAAYRARRMAPTAARSSPSAPGYRRWTVLLNQVQGLLTTLTEEMTQYWDDRSDRWQESERGEGFHERLEGLEAMLEQCRDWGTDA